MNLIQGHTQVHTCIVRSGSGLDVSGFCNEIPDALDAPGRNRTCDPLLRRQVLFPLSYEGDARRPGDFSRLDRDLARSRLSGRVAPHGPRAATVPQLCPVGRAASHAPTRMR
jgi:hypothetical protein